MSYEDAGYDSLMNRKNIEQDTNLDTEDESSHSIPQVSSTSVSAGTQISSTGKLVIDWDHEFVTASNGARVRTAFGNLDGIGNYGIRVVDEKGRTRIELSDSVQQISMYDSGGDEIVKLDTTGLTVKDEDGNTIIDTVGLVSSTAFVSGSATKNSDQEITTSSMQDISDLSVTFTASSSRSVNVLFLASITCSYTGEFEGNMIFRFVLDGTTEIGPRFIAPCMFDEVTAYTVSSQFIYSLPSGSHTVKIQVGLDSAPSVPVWIYGATYSTTGTVLNYVALGK